jgi:thiol-disulfide isomerase/thioredoxin
MKANQLLHAALLAGVIGASSDAITKDGTMGQQMAPAAVPLPIEGELPSLDGANEWLNSPPLSPAGLRGKVVLVQFWTYTCINWLRTVPYVRAWAEKYKDQGLVVIGVSTPEFEFEHSIDNVRRAVKDMGITWPVAVDNDYAIWRAFNNQYWPALYFIDARGRLRQQHFGEGEYERSEMAIQKLLAETSARADDQGVVSVTATGFELPADWRSLRSPEIYLGHDRTENFSSPGGAALGRRRVYAASTRLELNRWALAGEWTMANQATVLNTAGGRIVCRFHARDVHLVMGPLRQETAVRFRVSMDGQPPGPAHGLDVDDSGGGTVGEQRLYQLIRQPGPIVDKTFEIEFLDAGVEAFAFTFG